MLSIARRTPSVIRDRILRRSFDIWQRMGINITPNHYYQPIPDTRQLSSSIWTIRSELPGLDMNEHGQLRMLDELTSTFQEEYAQLKLWPSADDREYYIHNESFGSVDGELLYCMIRYFRPRRFIEVGAGRSTLLSALALSTNNGEGTSSEFTSIDPFPADWLRHGVRGLSRMLVKRVEDIPLEEFAALEEGDILFIDSSHVLRIGGDVRYEFLEILPRLKPGVVIHVHDVFLPAEYPRHWVLTYRLFYSEQYLLQALLAFNDAFKVLIGASYMHLTHPERLEAAFPSYRRDRCWPGSFWIQKTR